jgi:hypothetical protein
MMIGSELTESHKAFIDDLTTVIGNAKDALTNELIKSFDLDVILKDPEYGKTIMANLMLMLEDYLDKAASIGQELGDAKKEQYARSNS